jgi:hypothetical protein
MAQQIAGLVYPAEQVADLTKIVVPVKVRKQFRTPPEAPERGVIVWHPGLSLLQQAKLQVVRERELFDVRMDLRNRDFTTVKLQAGFRRVCLPAPDTRDLCFAVQEMVVSPFSEVACPVTVATWTWMVHFLVTGESLGCGTWMRCAEKTSPGSHIGLYARTGSLQVFDCWDNVWGTSFLSRRSDIPGRKPLPLDLWPFGSGIATGLHHVMQSGLFVEIPPAHQERAAQ